MPENNEPLLVVLDTNILVSALWIEDSNPGRVIQLINRGALRPCYDARILIEYEDVLAREKFDVSPSKVTTLMRLIQRRGLFVVHTPQTKQMVDEYDQAFYEVMRFCDAILITGNLKHFPRDLMIVSPTQFLAAL